VRAHRQDPRWQKAREDYVAEYEDLDPDEAFVLRIRAATEMNRIEHEYLDAEN